MEMYLFNLPFVNFCIVLYIVVVYISLTDVRTEIFGCFLKGLLVKKSFQLILKLKHLAISVLLL